jgi:RNA polymerase sigma factor (sigma-70 family)
LFLFRGFDSMMRQVAGFHKGGGKKINKNQTSKVFENLGRLENKFCILSPCFIPMFFKRSTKKVIHTDEELLGLFKQTGETAYLGEAYERYIHLVFGVCLKYLKNEEESKDMVMLIFEKLIIEVKKAEVRNFKSWLHVLARNQCLMLLRSASYRASKGLGTISDDPDMETFMVPHHIDDDDLEKRLQDLEKAVEHLPPEQQECIRLFYIEERCYKEIVEITGYDLNKVKSYIQNGKRNLKIYLHKINEQP